MSGNEDAPFRHYSLKSRVTAWVSRHLFDHMTYTVRHGLLKGMKRKGGLGWLPAILSPGTVTKEHRFWEDLDLSGRVVYDIGAFHGLLTLFFAAHAKTVVSFEPNTQSRTRLLENVSLNGLSNVITRPVGVGSKRETRDLVIDPLAPGGSSLGGKVADELRRSDHVVNQQVSIVQLDDEITESALPAPDFIKIDTEGWEFEALYGARRTLQTYRPALFLEMHGETINEKKRKVAEIVALLLEVGYTRIRHVETGSDINLQNSPVAMQGHLYCEFTETA